eukprot:515602-Amphidinium_carterae.1
MRYDYSCELEADAKGRSRVEWAEKRCRRGKPSPRKRAIRRTPSKKATTTSGLSSSRSVVA